MSQSRQINFKPTSAEDICSGDLLTFRVGIIAGKKKHNAQLSFDTVIDCDQSVLILETDFGPFIKMNNCHTAFKCLHMKENEIVWIHCGMMTRNFFDNCLVSRPEK